MRVVVTSAPRLETQTQWLANEGERMAIKDASTPVGDPPSPQEQADMVRANELLDGQGGESDVRALMRSLKADGRDVTLTRLYQLTTQDAGMLGENNGRVRRR